MTDNFKFNVGDKVRNSHGNYVLIIARNAGKDTNEYWCKHSADFCGTYLEPDITIAPPEQRDFMGAWAWAKEGRKIKRISSSTVYFLCGNDRLVYDSPSYTVPMWAELIEATDWVLA